MTESPRWERESQEDLRPAPQPDPTSAYDTADLDDLDLDDDEAGFEDELPDREPRLAALREAFGDALAAARESLGDSLSATRETLSLTAGRVARWFAALDRRPDFDIHLGRDPIAELDPPADDEFGLRAPTASEPGLFADDGAGSRFPTSALGYNRQAVDRHVAELEHELGRLREAVDPPVSLTEEIERLGEQTASILVVAHDKAHETAREAQARAARAVSDAARNAERITAEAQRRLCELDEETDAVWHERERLLEDVRVVSASLASLAEDASERFPAAALELEAGAGAGAGAGPGPGPGAGVGAAQAETAAAEVPATER